MASPAPQQPSVNQGMDDAIPHGISPPFAAAVYNDVSPTGNALGQIVNFGSGCRRILAYTQVKKKAVLALAASRSHRQTNLAKCAKRSVYGPKQSKRLSWK